MKSASRRVLWVVEMRLDGGDWLATTGLRFSRDDARMLLKEWRKRNPDDKFRVVEYAPGAA